MLSVLLAMALSSATRPSPKPIDAGSWIGPADYPPAALRLGVSGTVYFELAVDAAGTVKTCKVTQSSGATMLDDTTCTLLARRARFEPAVDEAGRAVASVYSNRVRWTLPILPPPILAPPVTLTAPFARPFVARNMANGLHRTVPYARLFPLHPDLSEPPPAEPVSVADDASPPADPAVRYGQLPNGLRYEILRNPLPRGAVSIRMRIGVGSLDESEAQRGYAHLLEHMVLRGTAHVPDGEFGRSLEPMGLRFGTDSNAHTMPEDTTYELDFPASTLSASPTGMFLLREIAGRATIAPATLEAERGVVQAEARARDNAGARVEKARGAFLLAGQRLPLRWTEGTDSAIAAATATGLRAFYTAHYRPDTTMLIVTGDVNPDLVVSDITADFSDWTAPGSAAPQPGEGGVQARGQAIKFFVAAGAPELAEADWVAPYDATPDTIGRERRDMITAIAVAILNERLSRIAEQPNAPFTAAALQHGRFYKSAMVTTLSVIPVSGNHMAALAAARLAQRRLIAFGATQAELDRALARTRSAIAQMLAAAASRNTTDLANAMLAVAESGDVFTSPAQAAADAGHILATITLADVKAAAADMTKGAGPLLFISSGKPLVGGEPAIARAFALANAAPLGAPPTASAKVWPYTGFGAPGRIVDRKDIADLGVTIVRFANDTSVTIKAVPQPKDSILADLNFGAGLSGLPPGLERSYWMMGASAGTFVAGGLGKATTADVSDELSGKIASVKFGVTEDRFHLIGSTRDADLDTQLQLLTAYIADPAFRPEAFQRAKAALAASLPQVEESSSAVADSRIMSLLHNGDPRWSFFPSAEQLAGARPDDFARLLRPSLAGPLNLVLVGDVDVERAIAAAQATIGALPPRSPRPTPRAAHFPAAPAAPVVVEDHDRGGNDIVFAAWPTTGFFASTVDARAMQVLSQIVQARLIAGLRARDGLTYAPTTLIDQSEVFPFYGMIAARIEIAPDKADQVLAALTSIMSDLAARPVSIEELDRARTPILDASRAQMFVINYWLAELVGVDDDIRRVDAIRTRLPDLAAVKPADILRLARTYFAGKTPFCLIVRPLRVSQPSR